MGKLWYFKPTRQAQSNTPWNGWVSEDTIKQYKDIGWEEVDENFIPPKFLSQAISEAVQRIQSGAKAAYIGGFYSDASGEMLYYDSDEDTQKLISNIYNRTKESDWETKVRYPGVAPAGKAPIRARPNSDSPETEKEIQLLDALQLKKLMDDMDDAFYTVKLKVWRKQAEIQDIVNDNTLFDTEEKKVAGIDSINF